MNRDKDKTKEQLLEELADLRRQISETKALKNECLLANKELVEAQRYAQDIINSSMDMIIAVDKKRKICGFNLAAQKIFGYSTDEILGKHINVLYSDFNEGEKVHQSIRETGQFLGEISNKRKDGEILPTFLSATVLHDTNGNFVGFMGISRDITEQKKLEEEHQKVRGLEAIGILARGIAHDFNNLLTGILGNISLVKTYTDPKDKSFELLTRAENISVQAHELTVQLHTYARSTVPDTKLVRIDGLMRDAVESALKNSKVKCDYSLPDSLWPVEIDEGQISHVVHNLVINACEAMAGSGKIEISAENMTVEKEKPPFFREGEYIKIIIKDHGPGIPQEYLTKIFTPYFTVRGLGGRESTGLGLAVCYYVIKSHNGHISVESNPGMTAFSIYLPAKTEI